MRKLDLTSFLGMAMFASLTLPASATVYDDVTFDAGYHAGTVVLHTTHTGVQDIINEEQAVVYNAYEQMNGILGAQPGLAHGSGWYATELY